MGAEQRCRQCGECCRHVGAFLVWGDDDFVRFLKLHGAEVLRRDDIDHEGQPKDRYCIDVLVPGSCSECQDNGDGTYSCKLHTSDKPRICRDYPHPNAALYSGCGYHIEEDADDPI